MTEPERRDPTPRPSDLVAPLALAMQRNLRLAPLLVALGALVAPAAYADVLVVAGDGSGDHVTIQAAIDAAGDGDIVLVRPGDYPGSIVLTAIQLAVVADGSARIEGKVLVRDLGSDDFVLLSGFAVEPAVGPPLSSTYEGALDIRGALGAVRIQDCELVGADSEGLPPGTPLTHQPHGGPGLLVEGSSDVALIDSRATGGAGSLSVVAVSGSGGDGVRAANVGRLSLVRSVLTGGDGGRGDDPGDGGAGTRIVGTTDLLIAYSGCFGGAAGCWEGFPGSPGWTVDGGTGLVRGAGTETVDFEGLFEGGPAAGGLLCLPTPAGGSAGAAESGPGAVQRLSGFPNGLVAPAVVRSGSPWEVRFFAEEGEEARLFFGSGTTFAFAPALEQPRLIGGADVRRFPAVDAVPAGGIVARAMPVLQVPASLGGLVQGLQGFLVDPGVGTAFSSPRFVVFLAPGL